MCKIVKITHPEMWFTGHRNERYYLGYLSEKTRKTIKYKLLEMLRKKKMCTVQAHTIPLE